MRRPPPAQGMMPAARMPSTVWAHVLDAAAAYSLIERLHMDAVVEHEAH